MNGNSYDNWEFYSRRVEDKAASILLDMGLFESAPRADLPVLGHVGVVLRAPDQDGLPDDDEYRELGAMEEALAAAVAGLGLYAGRCIRDGRMDFFFYLPELYGFGDQVEKAMAAFAGHSWSSGSTADPDWEVYLDFLYPRAQDILAIQNRRALARLAQLGDNFALPRLVEHWIGCPVGLSGAKAAMPFRQRGFIVEILDPITDEKPEADEAPWAYTLRLTRLDSLEGIDDLVFMLADIAGEQGAVYLGWACPATSAEPDGSLP